MAFHHGTIVEFQLYLFPMMGDDQGCQALSGRTGGLLVIPYARFLTLAEVSFSHLPANVTAYGHYPSPASDFRWLILMEAGG